MEKKDRKKQEHDCEIKKRFKKTEQQFSRNVKEINWRKQTKLIYLVQLDESLESRMESEELLEAYRSQENFQQLTLRVVEKLKSVDEHYELPENEDDEEQEDFEKEKEHLYGCYDSENASIIDC